MQTSIGVTTISCNARELAEPQETQRVEGVTPHRQPGERPHPQESSRPNRRPHLAGRRRTDRLSAPSDAITGASASTMFELPEVVRALHPHLDSMATRVRLHLAGQTVALDPGGYPCDPVGGLDLDPTWFGKPGMPAPANNTATAKFRVALLGLDARRGNERLRLTRVHRHVRCRDARAAHRRQPGRALAQRHRRQHVHEDRGLDDPVGDELRGRVESSSLRWS